MNSKSKNDIFYFVLLVLTMITMVVGVTFTYFSILAKEKDDSTKIHVGSLSINYVDGKEINTYALLPIEEPDLNTKYSVYKKQFYVSSDGTLDQTLDLYITVTESSFESNTLKFALYDSENNKLSTGYIPSISGSKVLMASGIPLKSNNIGSFTVLIWLQENNQNQDEQQGKAFIGGFDITATQVKYE